MARQEEDKAMEGLLRRSLARDAAAQPCPDAEIFAAYMERSLSAGETSRCELHFSQCARCREQIAAMVRLGEAVAGEKNGAKAAEARRRAWALGWHWLAPAAVLLTFALVWFIRYRVQTRTEGHIWTDGLVAVNRPPANPSPAPPATLGRTGPTHQAESTVSKTQAASPTPAVSAPAIADSTRGMRAREELRKESEPKQSGGEALNGIVAGAEGQTAPSRVSGAAGNFKLIAPQPAPAAAPKVAAAAPELKNAAPIVSSTPPVGSNSAGAQVEQAPKAMAETVEVTSAAPIVSGEAGGAGSGTVAGTGGAKAGELSGSQNTNELTVMDAASSQKQMTKLQAYGKKPAKKANAVGNPAMTTAQPVTVYSVIPTPVPGIKWRIASEGFVERTQDGGATWQGTLIEEGAQWEAGSAPTTKICWIVGNNGLIYVTKDSKTWKKISPPGAFDFVSVMATDASNVTVTAADGLKYATSNGGKKWRQVQ
jgi:hypothetical protein